MTSRIAFDSWQMLFPAIGIVVFMAVFIWVVVRASRMKKPRLNHMLNLPLEEEHSRPVSHVRNE